MPENFAAGMRVLLIEGARGRLSAGLRRLALAVAGLLEAQAVSLRSVASDGAVGAVANPSRLALRPIARALPAGIGIRGLIVAAGVAVTVTAVTFVIASVARSRRSAAGQQAAATQQVPATPQKDPIVIPIHPEPEPVTAAEGAVAVVSGTSAEQDAIAEPGATVAHEQRPQSKAGDDDGSGTITAADVPTETR